eukprot:11370-Heterococcus_DN1.PRE.1
MSQMQCPSMLIKIGDASLGVLVSVYKGSRFHVWPWARSEEGTITLQLSAIGIVLFDSMLDVAEDRKAHTRMQFCTSIIELRRL